MSSAYLKTASCEIICHCDQVHCLPDPKHVPIDAICFSISESRMYTGSKSFIFHCLNDCTVLNWISFSFVKSRHPVLNSSQVELIHCKNEANLLRSFFTKLHCEDPDFLIGYDLEKLSFGYILKRSKFILNGDEMLFIGRSPTTHLSDINQLIGETYAHNEIMHHSVAPGRELINIWKQYRHYHNPKSTDLFSAILNLLSIKFPIMSHENLSSWVSSSNSQHMKFALKYIWKQTLVNFMLISKMDIIPKISASSRINGVIFHDAYNRGSQFQVESIMIRNSRKYNYLLPSVSVKQRNYMAPIMSIPLTLEPATKFYTNPVIVLDFQSLYPSIMIAFNYCYTTCLGLADNYKKSDGPFLKLGTLYYEPSCQNIKSILDNAKFSPNGTGFVEQKARQGMLPSLLKQLLRCRILAKTYMKRKKSDPDKAKDFDFLQMGLKLLSNVFFGYSAA
ncbi:MAG: DNA polymerase zeta catalytic subunit [Paramarteilia canceri]